AQLGDLAEVVAGGNPLARRGRARRRATHPPEPGPVVGGPGRFWPAENPVPDPPAARPPPPPPPRAAGGRPHPPPRAPPPPPSAPSARRAPRTRAADTRGSPSIPPTRILTARKPPLST